MLSNEEFARQRAAALNTKKKEEERKNTPKEDYTSNKSIYNKSVNSMGKDSYKLYVNRFKLNKPIMYLSIPFCIIISLAATFCLLLMGLVKTRLIMWFIFLLFFIILYSGIVTWTMTRSVNSIDNRMDIMRLKEQFREEIEKEIRQEEHNKWKTY